jgi:hypothetical protein
MAIATDRGRHVLVRAVRWFADVRVKGLSGSLTPGENYARAVARAWRVAVMVIAVGCLAVACSSGERLSQSDADRTCKRFSASRHATLIGVARASMSSESRAMARSRDQLPRPFRSMSGSDWVATCTVTERTTAPGFAAIYDDAQFLVSPGGASMRVPVPPHFVPQG